MKKSCEIDQSLTVMTEEEEEMEWETIRWTSSHLGAHKPLLRRVYAVRLSWNILHDI